MSPARIFLVCNEPERLLFTIFLEQAGYAVQSFSSYEAGIAACLSQPPDLLLVLRNFEQPGKGLDFCRQLRSIATLPGFPIIMGDVDAVHLEEKAAFEQAYAAGANACFGLVFDIADVREEIEILLADPTVTHLADRQTRRREEQRRAVKKKSDRGK